MPGPYSQDLRDRVVAAVEREGMSTRQAAARFAVSVSTAGRWTRRQRERGDSRRDRMGGNRPRAIRGADHDWLLERCRRAPFTLRGLVAELAERGVQVDYRSVWNFVHEQGLSYKKRPMRQRNRTARTSPAGAGNGGPDRTG